MNPGRGEASEPPSCLRALFYPCVDKECVVEKGTGERSHFNGGLDEGSLGDLLLIEIIQNPECEWKLRRPKVIDRE